MLGVYKNVCTLPQTLVYTIPWTERNAFLEYLWVFLFYFKKAMSRLSHPNDTCRAHMTLVRGSHSAKFCFVSFPFVRGLILCVFDGVSKELRCLSHTQLKDELTNLTKRTPASERLDSSTQRKYWTGESKQTTGKTVKSYIKTCQYYTTGELSFVWRRVKKINLNAEVLFIYLRLFLL